MCRLESSLRCVCGMGFEYSFVVVVGYLDIVGIVPDMQRHFNLVKAASKALDCISHLYINSALMCQGCHILLSFPSRPRRQLLQYSDHFLRVMPLRAWSSPFELSRGRIVQSGLISELCV